MSEVKMYGAAWCSDCRRSKALLDGDSVAYEYVDLEADPSKAAEAEAIAGRKNIPVIQFADGAVLVEPSDDELRSALSSRGLL